MDKVTKLRKRGRQELRLQFWEGLATYVNSTPLDDVGLAGFQRAFHASVWGTPVHLDWEQVSEVKRYAKGTRTTVENSWHFWAAEYQAELRNVLTWLAQPRERAALGHDAASFLEGHDLGFRWSLGEPNSGFRDKYEVSGEEDGEPILLWAELRECDSVVAPICKFILGCIWEFQEGDPTYREAIPLHICEREGCGKFTVSERRGRKRFCSDQCRALAFQRSRDDWNEYMRNYRKTIQKRKKRARSK